MFVEKLFPQFHHEPDLDSDVHLCLCQKTSETVSRTGICKRSVKNFTEYIRLLFCNEKIIFSNKFSLKYRAKTRTSPYLEHRKEVVKLNLKRLELSEEVVDDS